MSATSIALDKDRIHRVTTPEGISLPFVVAAIGDRVAAFLLDLLIITLCTFAVWILSFLGYWMGLGTVSFSFALLVGFLLWNFYFVHFEISGGGATFGKRKMGVRVISRDGGPLTAEAVFARNLMRNLEFYLPVSALLVP